MQRVNIFSGVNDPVVPGTEREVCGRSLTFSKNADGPPSAATAANPARSIPVISNAPCNCIGPRHAAHAADHDVEHRHQRQEAGPDFERVFPGEQSFGNDAAGLNLNDHVRHGV